MLRPERHKGTRVLVLLYQSAARPASPISHRRIELTCYSNLRERAMNSLFPYTYSEGP